MDRSTKIILLAIACGLWANVALQMTRPAAADNSLAWADLKDTLDVIANSVGGAETHISRISRGVCENKKLC